MADEDQRHAPLLRQPNQQIGDPQCHIGIERRGRFIRDQQIGITGQGECDQNTLPLPAGEFVGELAQARLRLGDADFFQQALRPGPGRAPGHPQMNAHRFDQRVADAAQGIQR